jgi:hypothetical protein
VEQPSGPNCAERARTASNCMVMTCAESISAGQPCRQMTAAGCAGPRERALGDDIDAESDNTDYVASIGSSAGLELSPGRHNQRAPASARIAGGSCSGAGSAPARMEGTAAATRSARLRRGGEQRPGQQQRAPESGTQAPEQEACGEERRRAEGLDAPRAHLRPGRWCRAGRHHVLERCLLRPHAEHAAASLTEGARVIAVGALRTRAWTPPTVRPGPA